jgi:hypothetical protein
VSTGRSPGCSKFFGLPLVHTVSDQHLDHGRLYLVQRLASYVGEDQGLIVDLRDRFLLDQFQERRRRELADLRVYSVMPVITGRQKVA